MGYGLVCFNKNRKLKYRLKVLMSIIMMMVLILPSQVLAAPTMTANPTPSPLMETNLDGAGVQLILSGAQFKSTISKTDFKLNKAPNGLSIATVQFISSTEAIVNLAFTGQDFDGNISDFVIVALASGIVSNVNVNSTKMFIYAVIEEISVTANSAPSLLFEKNLQGSILQLSLTGNVDYVASLLPEHFLLNQAPTGLTVTNVSRVNNDIANLSLSFSGADFDYDIPNFSITILPAGNNKTTYITSNDCQIKAVQEIEGYGDYVSSGETFPTTIQISGYNARDRVLYINYELQTKKSVAPTQSPVFNHFIDVFNGSGLSVGNKGTPDLPISNNGAQGSNRVQIPNQELKLNSVLPASFRIVITVTSLE